MFRNYIRYFLFVHLFMVSNSHAQQVFNGYFIYGFETMILETCEGELYWMWKPDDFKAQYAIEGYRNPVIVKGSVHQPNPDQNMYSPLREIKALSVNLAINVCQN